MCIRSFSALGTKESPVNLSKMFCFCRTKTNKIISLRFCGTQPKNKHEHFLSFFRTSRGWSHRSCTGNFSGDIWILQFRHTDPFLNLLSRHRFLICRYGRGGYAFLDVHVIRVDVASPRIRTWVWKDHALHGYIVVIWSHCIGKGLAGITKYPTGLKQNRRIKDLLRWDWFSWRFEETDFP